MAQLVYLDYTFLFNPDLGWTHIDQFEKDLQAFFATKGVEGHFVTSIDPHSGKRIVYLTAQSKLDQMKTDNKPPKPIDPVTPANNDIQDRIRKNLSTRHIKSPRDLT